MLRKRSIFWKRSGGKGPHEKRNSVERERKQSDVEYKGVTKYYYHLSHLSVLAGNRCSHYTLRYGLGIICWIRLPTCSMNWGLKVTFSIQTLRCNLFRLMLLPLQPKGCEGMEWEGILAASNKYKFLSLWYRWAINLILSQFRRSGNSQVLTYCMLCPPENTTSGCEPRYLGLSELVPNDLR